MEGSALVLKQWKKKKTETIDVRRTGGQAGSHMRHHRTENKGVFLFLTQYDWHITEFVDLLHIVVH